MVAVALASAGCLHAPVPARASIAAATATPACSDLLARVRKTPAHVVYAGCRYEPDRQGKPLVATYRVAGRFAAATETSLIRTTGLRRLKRSCCQWDSSGGQFRDTQGRNYSIRMVSEETAARTRAAWPGIERFEITVELLTEDI